MIIYTSSVNEETGYDLAHKCSIPSTDISIRDHVEIDSVLPLSLLLNGNERSSQREEQYARVNCSGYSPLRASSKGRVALSYSYLSLVTQG